MERLDCFLWVGMVRKATDVARWTVSPPILRRSFGDGAPKFYSYHIAGLDLPSEKEKEMIGSQSNVYILQVGLSQGSSGSWPPFVE
jgi:hypothetical protein